MPRIRVVPDQLRATSVQFQQVALALRTMEARTSGAVRQVPWPPPEQALLESGVRQARALALNLADQADLFARQLLTKAEAFDATDAEAAAALGELAGAWLAWQAAYRPLVGEDPLPLPDAAEAAPAAIEIAAPPADLEADDGSGGKLRTIEDRPVVPPPTDQSR